MSSLALSIAPYNKHRIRVHSLLIFFVSLLIFLVERKISVIFNVTFIYFIPLFFLKDRKLVEKYSLSFLIGLFFLIITSFLYYINLNNIAGANDEMRFFLLTLNRSNKLEFGSTIYNVKGSTKVGYIYITGFIAYINSKFMLGTTIFINKIVSLWAYSITIVIIYKILEMFNFPEKHIHKILYKVMFFGIFLEFAVTGVRDSWIILLNSLFIYFILKKISLPIKLFILLSISFFLTMFRIENALFCVSIIFMYYFYKIFIKIIQNIKQKIYRYLFTLVVFVTIFFLLYIIMNISFFSDYINMFNKLNSQYTDILTTNSSSLGAKLRKLPFPLNIIAQILFGLLGGFPPENMFESPIVNMSGALSGEGSYFDKSLMSISLARFLLFVGLLQWYSKLPYLFWGLFKKINLKQNIHLVFILIVSFIYVSFSSIITPDLGRLIPYLLYLYIYSCSVYYTCERSLRLKIHKLTILGFLFLYLIYNVLKY